MPNYEGLTVDEAIQVGLKELQLSRKDVEVKVLAEGKKGFFGIGKKAAVVSVVAINSPAEGPVETVQSVTRTEKVEKTVSSQKPQVPSSERLPDSEAITALAAYLTKITKELNAPAEVKVETNDQNVVFHLESEKAGMLIGKHGKVLNALQYLAQVFIHRMAENKLVVVVNVGDYRERREATLTRLANNTADKVLRTGQAVYLEPMPAFERKQIHAILTDNQNVKTHSEGDEPYRYLVVNLNK